ncbi:hypothetical protein KGY77_10160 [Candidatus Bipolaricaulota bacterium]|nr:hypothetical protein [Candidatus Bipolaricaulota bacterium]MBS3792988.1 hypothetical protein [Candidatus Bipolaricaulota bacterium]
MNASVKQFRSGLYMILALVILLIVSVPAIHSSAREGTMDFYIVPETEYLPVANLLTHLLEELGFKVNEKIQYRQVGFTKIRDGQGDLFLGMTFPPSKDGSWNDYAHEFCNLGPVYEDVVAGWGVPGYVAVDQLDSFEELSSSKVRRKLQGEIISFTSDQSLLKSSRRILDTVEGLGNYKLVEIDRMAALSELDLGTRSEEWIVMIMKRPSVLFSIYDPRFIVKLTDEQSVNLLARQDLMEKYPNKVTEFLSRFYLPIELVDELTLLYDEGKGSAARKFVQRHPELVNYWLRGQPIL